MYKRQPSEDLAIFRKNTDGKGTYISDFVKKVGYYASVCGVMHALVDMPTLNKRGLTKKAVQESKLSPYCSLVYPTQLVDWSLDSRGNLNWIVIEMVYYDDADPTKERTVRKHYKIITREQWWIEDEDGNRVKYEDGSASEGQNELGIVPLITMYHKDESDDKVGESLLKDIVYINRAIMNWCSCIDEQIERQTFSQLIVPDAGELAEESETGDDPLYRIGTSSIWTFNAQANHPPQFISPNVENISTIWRLVVDHIKEIYRIAGLIGSTDDMYVSRSGRAAQMGFIGVNSVLAEKAARYQKFENDISKVALMYLGKNPEEYDEVKYPDSFDIKALQDDIDTYFKIMERNMSITLNKALMKNISRRALPLASQKLASTIEKEIEANSGIVEPISREKQTAEGEDGNPNSNLGKSFRTKEDLEFDEKTKKKKEE